jgi:hypothetical protein
MAATGRLAVSLSTSCASMPSRMLKKPSSFVLAMLRGSTLESFSEVGSTEWDFPFAKIRSTGERLHKVRCVPLASSLPAALFGTRRVSARQVWVGEKSGLFEHPATF